MTAWSPESGLRAQYPTIPWDQPLLVEIGKSGSRDLLAFVCRYCVAKEGLRGMDVLIGIAGYGSRAAHAEHIRIVHNSPPGPPSPPKPAHHRPVG